MGGRGVGSDVGLELQAGVMQGVGQSIMASQPACVQQVQGIVDDGVVTAVALEKKT